MIPVVTPKSKKKPVVRFLVISIGAIVALAVASFLWVYFSLFSGRGLMELSDYHPFRSPEAKVRFLSWYDERARQWPVASEERMVETTYGQTFVRISGRAGAPPIVLLPGGGASSLMWQPNIESLSAKYRTYAVDNIYDVGRSVYTKKIESAGDLVQWLDEVLVALDLQDSVSLVGLSHGGWLAAQYALHHSDRLRKVVLIAPAATILPFSREFIKRGVLTLLPLRVFFRKFMYWLLADLAKSEDGQKLIDTAVDDAWLARTCFKFKMPLRPNVLTDSELRQLNVPVLFLVGENEKIYSPNEAVRRIIRVAPTWETEVIPRCGHDLTVLQAATVNKKILEFLE